MKGQDYEALERFGFDRGTGVSPSEGAGVATLVQHWYNTGGTNDLASEDSR